MIEKIFGKKMGMTQYFLDEGKMVPVTIVKTWPNIILQKKTKENDGYEALQVGFEPQKEKRVNKPLRGHFKAVGDNCYKNVREIKVSSTEDFELGQEITAEIFQIGEIVNISSRSKGRGFSGVIKRWGFSGGKKTHGCRSHRVPSYIGASATPGRVFKGKKLPGRYGYQKTTINNLSIVDVRTDLGVIAIKGSVPGSQNSIVEISKHNI